MDRRPLARRRAGLERLRPTRPYDATADRRLGAPRPPSHATMLALRRVVDPGAAEERRRHYELLVGGVGDLVPPPFRALAPGACPLVVPIEAADKRAVLRRLRAAGVRALDLWSVPHPSLPRHATRTRRRCAAR